MKKCIFLFAIAISIACFGQKNLATVDDIHGVKVFCECSPIAEYEVLGEVAYAGKGKNYSYVMAGVVIAGTSEAQYNEVRDGLITQAVLANRDVQGVILHVNNQNSSTATMIKFKDGATGIDQARVNKYEGYYVFCDSKPNSDYTYLKKVKCGATDGFTDIRSQLIKNAHRKGNAIIMHFVTGGWDNAEVITVE